MQLHWRISEGFWRANRCTAGREFLASFYFAELVTSFVAVGYEPPCADGIHLGRCPKSFPRLDERDSKKDCAGTSGADFLVVLILLGLVVGGRKPK